MKKARSIVAVLLAVVLVLALAGCGGGAAATSKAAAATTAAATQAATTTTAATTTAASTTAAAATTGAAKPAGDVKVAYLLPSSNVEFWLYIEAGIKEKCDSYGYSFKAFDSQNEANTQLKNAQNAITQGYNLLIISPLDSSSCPAVLDEAEAANVPVIIADVGTESGKYASYISTPNEDGAKQVGEYFAKYLKENNLKGTIGEITIPLSRLNGQLRQKGFKTAVEAAGFKMGTSLSCSTSTYDESEGFTQNIVNGDPNLIGIWSHQATSTIGVVTALEGADLIGKVKVACFDGSPEIVQYIRDKKVTVCGAQQPVEMGRKALEAGKVCLDGGTPEKEIGVPVLLITEENVNQEMATIEKTVYTDVQNLK